jgi:hypothetical protein
VRTLDIGVWNGSLVVADEFASVDQLKPEI